MNRTSLESRLKDFFESSAIAQPVAAAYLYGSRARGDERPDSDVDVAVLLEGPEPALYPSRALVIEGELEGWLRLPTQVIALQDASVDLVHRVLRDGVLVRDRDRSARIAFEVRARNEYFDLLPILRTCRRSSVGR